MTKVRNKQRQKADWPSIRCAYLEGQPVADIAKEYGVSEGRIYNRSSAEAWTANIPEIAFDKLILDNIIKRRAERAGLSVKEAGAQEAEERAIGWEKIRHNINQAERINSVMAGCVEDLLRDPFGMPAEKVNTLYTLQQLSSIITINTSRLAAMRRQAWKLDHDDVPDQSKIICSKELDEIYAKGKYAAHLRDLTVKGRAEEMAAYDAQRFPSSRDTGGTIERKNPE